MPNTLPRFRPKWATPEDAVKEMSQQEMRLVIYSIIDLMRHRHLPPALPTFPSFEAQVAGHPTLKIRFKKVLEAEGKVTCLIWDGNICRMKDEDIALETAILYLMLRSEPPATGDPSSIFELLDPLR